MKHFSIASPALLLAALLAGCFEQPPEPHGAFFEPKSPILRTEGPVFISEEDFLFIDSLGKRWLAPKGTKTDGATIPQWALSVTGDRMDSGYRNAALVHDAYCQGGLNGNGISYRKDTWQNVHRMFYEACVANGVDPYRGPHDVFRSLDRRSTMGLRRPRTLHPTENREAPGGEGTPRSGHPDRLHPREITAISPA